MASRASFPARLMAGVGVCLWTAGAALAGQAGAGGAQVTSVKLKVAVDRSSNCKFALSASIGASGMGKIWYRFAGPPGVTFDFGEEGTETLEFSTSFGAGKGANMSQDIHGEFRVDAAMVNASGKHGPVVSDAVRADYTCGNGSAVASPIAAGVTKPAAAAPAPSAQSRPAASAGFQVTAVKVGDYTATYNGSCPTNDMAFRWAVSANGAGSAVVRFLQQTRPIREETVVFSAAGTKVVTYRASDMGEPGGHYRGAIGLEVVSPNSMIGGHEPYTIECAPRAK
jgi:hypothetical protein